jgi:hypothetical protein
VFSVFAPHHYNLIAKVQNSDETLILFISKRPMPICIKTDERRNHKAKNVAA